MNLEFPSQMMKTIIGGYSTIDVPHLDFHSLEEVGEFIKTYGYDLSQPEEVEAVWSIYEQSILLLQKYILDPHEKIPDVLLTRQSVEDIRRLFLYASTKDHKKNPMQLWSCAILRVMHCVAHVDNDLFFNYTNEIQNQIFGPFQSQVVTDEGGNLFLGTKQNFDQVPLMKFELKAFKERHSMVIKTLSKPESVAMEIFDKMGVRFVTSHIFDAFRVVRYLRRENIINFANIVPHQSKNTLYPANIFLEVIDKLNKTKKIYDVEQIDKTLSAEYDLNKDRAEFKEKFNPFSDSDYKAIKFISRHLIKIKTQSNNLRFFYPYEIQVMDYQTYINNMSGTTSHAEYKQRQRKAAHDRVMGEIFFAPN
ncbi:MAG: TIGR04552 family protein [Oligoflexia bacterium]|nr:TIGR04552 family protein [Oligoflexia bacterium]